jgi:hypothetical protein
MGMFFISDEFDGFLGFELLISFCNSLHIFIFVIIGMVRIIGKFLFT